MTPKTLHHIVGPVINPIVKRCLDSWKDLKKHGFCIRVWNDQDIQRFISQHYPFALQAVLQARNHAEAADIARYLIVYHFGGYYFDWDIQLLDKDLFLKLAKEQKNGFLLRDAFDESIASEAFSAIKGELYLLRIVQEIVEAFQTGEREKMMTLKYSGPLRMRDVLRRFNTNQQVLKVKEVFLYDYQEITKMPEREITVPMIHYWLHSWLPKKDICTNEVETVATELIQ